MNAFAVRGLRVFHRFRLPAMLAPSLVVLVLLIAALAACRSSAVAIAPCPEGSDVLSELWDNGTRYVIAADGNVYRQSGEGCELFERYFTPSFESDNYGHAGDSVFIKTSEGAFPTRSNFNEQWERYGLFPELFVQHVADTDRIWNDFTLQSPLARTVADYVALRACILAGTSTFRDNRIDLADDPAGTSNRVLKFTAVTPVAGMVTSKASIESTTAYFQKGDDMWFEARYYFANGLPYSIVDFESQWFEQSPGPRIVFDNGALAIENQVGDDQDPYSVSRIGWVVRIVAGWGERSVGNGRVVAAEERDSDKHRNWNIRNRNGVRALHGRCTIVEVSLLNNGVDDTRRARLLDGCRHVHDEAFGFRDSRFAIRKPNSLHHVGWRDLVLFLPHVASEWTVLVSTMCLS
jgi:hypothetical protein